MNPLHDVQIRIFLGLILSLLTVASLIGAVLAKLNSDSSQKAVICNLNARIRAWWVMITVFCISVMLGGVGSALLFSLVSFMALREFITLTPTHRADHRALFWVFFVLLPLQYYLVATHWYGLFSILIPVYAYLWIPVRNAIAGDSTDFLARTAKIQWGLMACVYCVSYAPALLNLEIPGYAHQNVKLLCFLVFVVQISDVLQYVFGKCFGKHKICPTISPNKTLEGFVGGVLSSVVLGACMWWMTPFNPWQAAFMALAISLMGFGGGLVMSAIKRDRGVKDYGCLIPGHGGMMDRIDSLCFAAPVFFHMTRYFFVH